MKGRKRGEGEKGVKGRKGWMGGGVEGSRGGKRMLNFRQFVLTLGRL